MVVPHHTPPAPPPRCSLVVVVPGCGRHSSRVVTRQNVLGLQQCSCLCAVALPAVGVASGSGGGEWRRGTCWGLGQGSKCQAHGGGNNLNTGLTTSRMASQLRAAVWGNAFCLPSLNHDRGWLPQLKVKETPQTTMMSPLLLPRPRIRPVAPLLSFSRAFILTCVCFVFEIPTEFEAVARSHDYQCKHHRVEQVVICKSNWAICHSILLPVLTSRGWTL